MAEQTLFQVQLSDLAFATRVARGIPGQPPVDPTNCGPASAWLLGIINDQEVADMTRTMRGWSLAFWSAALDRRFPNFVHEPHAQPLTQETIERVGRSIANGAATLMLSQDTRDIGHYYVLSKNDMGLLQLFDAQRNEYIRRAPAIFNHIRTVYHGGAIGQPLRLTLFGQTARPGVVIPRAPAAGAAGPYQFGPRALDERNAAFLRALEAVNANPAGALVNASIADIPEERAPGAPPADRGPGGMEFEGPPAAAGAPAQPFGYFGAPAPQQAQNFGFFGAPAPYAFGAAAPAPAPQQAQNFGFFGGPAPQQAQPFGFFGAPAPQQAQNFGFFGGPAPYGFGAFNGVAPGPPQPAAFSQVDGGSTRHRSSLPTRRAGRSSFARKMRYTRRQRALRTGKGGYRSTKTGRTV